MVRKKLDGEKYKLYALLDDSGIRYIGLTIQPLHKRLSGHLVSCRQAFKHKKARHHRHCWIKSLLDEGLKPKIILLSEYETAEEVKKAEIDAIKTYPNLVNSTAGGDGLKEYKFSEETLARFSHKVDQYDKEGNFIATYKSISDAAFVVTGNRKNNSKISQVVRGVESRKTFYGYVWRRHTEPFNTYPIKGDYNWNELRRKDFSKYKSVNNFMLGKQGLEITTSRPVVITDKENIVLTVTETVKLVKDFTKLSRSAVDHILHLRRTNKNYNLFYATEEIKELLKQDKNALLNSIVGKPYDQNKITHLK